MISDELWHAADRTPRIMVLARFFRPGFKGGGPIASLSALLNQLGREYRWVVLTFDHDEGDREPYPGLGSDRWLRSTWGAVRYFSPGLGSLLRLGYVLRNSKSDLIYVNDFLSPRWGVWPLFLRRLGLLRGKSVLVAPRGQFSAGALGIKRWKKRIFLLVARLSGMTAGLFWHATNEAEAREIQQVAGSGARIWCASNLVGCESTRQTLANPPGGPLRLVFYSRLSPKKNLRGAVEIVGGLSFPVQFDVAGSADSRETLAEAEKLIASLPGNVSSRILGEIPPERVRSLLASYDALLLPTMGENFGHVILEALAAGCAPIISDRTPWRDLEAQGCGWVVPFDDEEGFRRVVTQLNAMNDGERGRMREAARKYALAYMDAPELVASTRKMFQDVLSGACVGRSAEPDAPLPQGALDRDGRHLRHHA